MNTEPKYDTEHRDQITCPYCGHEHRDSWEWDSGTGMGAEGDGEDECAACEETMHISRHVTTTYTTRKTEDAE